MTSTLRPLSPELLRHIGAADKPWLVVGKGPSFASFRDELNERFNVFGLNHAMRGRQVLIGHAIDVEVFEQLQPDDFARVHYLCVPWIPHVRQRRRFNGGKAFFGPGDRDLADYCRSQPLLRRYLDAGRLIAYNLDTAEPALRHTDLPLVKAGSFSASVALELLGQCGVREVRTLGIDGGAAYAPSFSDIEGKTRLQTGQTSFNIQFKEMAASIRRHAIISGPLAMPLPLPVFVGCMPEQELAYLVLKYSIEKNSSVSVRVQRLHEAVAAMGLSVPAPADPANHGRTPFSFQRFAIPALCDYQGRAVYLDSDMQVFADMRELAQFPLDDLQMVSAAAAPGSMRAPQFSVMLIDCAKLRWDVSELVGRLDRGALSYEDLMHHMRSVDRWAPALPCTWNSFEAYEEGRTQLVHYTDMDTQPWLNPWHPLGKLWMQDLIAAVAEGVIPLSLVEGEVARRNVRPSILEQLRRHEPDARRLPLSVLRHDLSDFFPVHRRQTSRLSRLHHESYRLRLMARHFIDLRIAPPVRRIHRVASRILGRASP